MNNGALVTFVRSAELGYIYKGTYTAQANQVTSDLAVSSIANSTGTVLDTTIDTNHNLDDDATVVVTANQATLVTDISFVGDTDNILTDSTPSIKVTLNQALNSGESIKLVLPSGITNLSTWTPSGSGTEYYFNQYDLVKPAKLYVDVAGANVSDNQLVTLELGFGGLTWQTTVDLGADGATTAQQRLASAVSGQNGIFYDNGFNIIMGGAPPFAGFSVTRLDGQDFYFKIVTPMTGVTYFETLAGQWADASKIPYNSESEILSSSGDRTYDGSIRVEIVKGGQPISSYSEGYTLETGVEIVSLTANGTTYGATGSSSTHDTTVDLVLESELFASGRTIELWVDGAKLYSDKLNDSTDGGDTTLREYNVSNIDLTRGGNDTDNIANIVFKIIDTDGTTELGSHAWDHTYG
jgi:hypothetical protein